MPIPLQGTAMTALLSPSPAPPRGILPIAILLSILVHILLLIGLGSESLSGPRPPEEIVVSLQSPPLQEALAANAPAPIVAPSDQENGEVPEGRAFRSDRNNRVEQETIARGIPNPGLPEGTAATNQLRKGKIKWNQMNAERNRRKAVVSGLMRRQDCNCHSVHCASLLRK